MKNIFDCLPTAKPTICLLFFSLLLSVQAWGQDFNPNCNGYIRLSLDQSCMRSIGLHEILDGGIYDLDNLYTITLDKTPGSPDCDGPWLSNSLGFSDLGQTYCVRVSYALGNTCTGVVEVMDSLGPKITCTGNQTRNTGPGQCDYTALNTEFDYTSASDNCPGGLLDYDLTGSTFGNGSNSLAGTVFQLGATTVTWRITDTYNSTKTCSFTVTISAAEICNNGLDDNCDGLVDQLHPTVSITDIITFFNAAVAAGTIVGSSGGGLNVFSNMLNQALNAAQPPPNLNLVIQKLNQCLDKSDGAGSDWIETGTGNGDDLQHLRELLLFAKENFECSGIPIPFAPAGGGGVTKIMSIGKYQTADRTTVSMDSNLPQLFQNLPNPFSNETSIGFYLPSNMEATLSVYDVTGRLVFSKTATYAKGENVVTVSNKELGVTGVMTYRLATSFGSAVRRMVRGE